jgi:putative ABC transport system substrate-binding protein
LADAQQREGIPKVGFLSVEQPEFGLAPFREGMRRYGYVEGQNVVLEVRSDESGPGGLDELAMDLVRRNVDIIVAGGSDSIRAAMRATKTIPIVMAQTSDAVASGFVANLAHPGGNVTGISSQAAAIGEKRIQLIKEVVPKATRVAVLISPANPSHPPGLAVLDKAARSLGLEIRAVEVREAKDLELAFRTMVRQRADAFIVLPNAMIVNHRARVLELASRNRLPSVYWRKEFAEAGGLISYGVDNPAMYRRAATYVDKILKGAKPGELPVEQPSEQEVLVNLKTARALGIRIPQSLLIRATRVIE